VTCTITSFIGNTPLQSIKYRWLCPPTPGLYRIPPPPPPSQIICPYPNSSTAPQSTLTYWCWQQYCAALSRNTNKMHLCNRIYYSKIYWSLNMFQSAHRSSSGALNCICSLWFIYQCGGIHSLHPLIHFPLSLSKGRQRLSGYINQRLQIKFRAPDDERCVAQNMSSLQ
jgi:hypothetical protein